MATTYTPLYTTTLGSATPTITISSIPATYTDLEIVLSLPANGTSNNSDGLRFQLNGDSGTNYSATWLTNSTTTAVSSRESSANRGRCGNISQTTNDIGTALVKFQNYSNTTTYKTVLGRSGNLNSNGDSNVFSCVSLWRSTSAINQIVFSTSSNANFAVGTTVSLYGIASTQALATTKATGGDSIVTSGGYTYHVFRSSGTFTPSVSLSADVLVVAGGGGANGNFGGGGGAGGLLGFTSQSLSATGYTVTVGAGGNGSVSSATNGSDSQFGALTLVKGGGYGGHGGPGSVGGNGGSGGGGGGYSGSAAGGTATSGQGYAGGAGDNLSNGTNSRGGGGGGAGAIGQTGGGNPSGYGGAGSSTYSTWGIATLTGQSVSGTTYYAGGGGGGGGTPSGVGGNGGGGTGGINQQVGFAAIANTGGGGGGGSGYDYSGGNGGSGIVIVRYAV